MRTALFLLLLGAFARTEPPATRTWIWHYDARMAEMLMPTYRDLLRSIPRDSHVIVGVATHEDVLSFKSSLGLDDRPDPRIEFIEAGRPVSGWARDRYIVFQRGGRTCVALPPPDSVGGGWHGDLDVGRALRRKGRDIDVIETELALEGGNVLVTRDRVFVGTSAILDNRQRLGMPDSAVRARLRELFGRPVVVVGHEGSVLAEEHIDMYLAAAPDGTLLLGDPRLAPDAEDVPELARIAVFSPGTRRVYAAAYDRIARQLRREGMRVARIPILHADDGLILTWTNVVLETRHGRTRAYAPNYDLGDVDGLAYACWRAAGVEVAPVAAGEIILLGGGVRCVTNSLVLAGAPEEHPRSATPAPRPAPAAVPAPAFR